MYRQRVAMAALILAGCWPTLLWCAPSRQVLLTGRFSPVVRGMVRDALEPQGLQPVDPTAALAVRQASRPGAGAAARKHLEQARQLYYAARTAEAAELLADELRRSEQALATEGEFELLSSLQLWLGISRAKHGQVAAAKLAFTAALDLGGGALDATQFPPTLLAVYSAADRERQRRLQQRITLSLEPPGAAAALDGRPIAGVTVTVPTGAHWLRVSAVGFQPAGRRIDVEKLPLTIKLALQRAPIPVVVEQLGELRDRGKLDTTDNLIVAAMCRVRGVEEALVVEETAAGDQVQLSFSRVRSADARALGRVQDTAPANAVEKLVRHAVARLWPPPPGVAAAAAPKPQDRPRPVYRRWWFWTTIGAVVTGGVVAAIAVTSTGKTSYTVVFP